MPPDPPQPAPAPTPTPAAKPSAPAPAAKPPAKPPAPAPAAKPPAKPPAPAPAATPAPAPAAKPAPAPGQPAAAPADAAAAPADAGAGAFLDGLSAQLKNYVTNNARTIATRGTAHIARTEGDTDACQPDVKTKAPIEISWHKVETKGRLSTRTNTSTKTVINGEIIWVDKGHVGIPGDLWRNAKSGHTTTTWGVETNKMFRGWAQNTTCSTDVFAEQRGVVRARDETIQNRGNTDGIVDGSEVDIEGALSEAFFKNTCVIREIKGEATETPADPGLIGKAVDATAGAAARAFGTGGDPVPLGKKRKDSKVTNFLEIYDGEKVDLECVRVDKTLPDEPVVTTCKLGNKHTKWWAQLANEGKLSTPKEEENTDKFTIDDSLTKTGLEIGNATVGQSTAIPGEAQGDSARSLTGVGASATLVGPSKLIRFFRAQEEPPKITVKATACGGTKDVELHVKPKGAIKYGISFELQGVTPNPAKRNNDDKTKDIAAFSTFVEKVAFLNQVLRKADAVKPLADFKNFDYTLELFKGLSLELGCEYKRCEEESDDFTPAHIRPAWWFKVEGSIVNASMRLRVPLDPLVASIIGGPAGTAVARGLNRLGISILYVQFTLGSTFTANLQVGQDQHGYLLGGSTGGGFTVTLSFEIRVTLDVYLAELSCAIVLAASGDYYVDVNREKSCLRSKRTFGFSSKLVLTGRAWIFEKTVEFDGPKGETDPVYRDWPQLF